MKMLLILTFISFGTFAKDAGVVLFSKGETFEQVGKETRKIKKGDKVKDSSIIITKEKSLIVLSLKDGSKVKVNKNSKLQIKLGKVTKAALYKGSSFFNVLKAKVSKGEKFKVVTKSASLGVRGTEFFVSYGKSKDSKDVWMCVNEGLVAVSPKNSKTEKLVKAGEGVHISDPKTVTDPAQLPWTKKLNWRLSSSDGDLENKVNIEDAYTDILDMDYD
jgi:hypothetical protein